MAFARPRRTGKLSIRRRFRITCLGCRNVRVEVDRVRRLELAYLRDHIAESHPNHRLPPESAMTEVLEYYHVVVIGNR